jgi:UDP-glucuronate decarboxylase
MERYSGDSDLAEVRDDVLFLAATLQKESVEFENQRILVTGGAGFLGSWMCDVLLEMKAKVICLDNFSSGRKENIQHLLERDDFKLIVHDISEEIFFDKKLDVVFHFASRAQPLQFLLYPIQILKSNTIGTWIALGIAKRHDARIVFASSSEVYGDPDPEHIPTSEDYTGNVNPVGPRACYDEAKRVGETFVNAYRIQHRLDTRILRIFNTFGPRMKFQDITYGRVIPRFIDQAINGRPLTVFGDGSQTRSFTYVTDLVEGILKAGWGSEASGEVMNIGSVNETTIIDLAKLIIDLTNSKSKITFQPLPKDDPRRRRPDVSKAKKIIGWNPKKSLDEGLQNTIEWFKSMKID